ncbi:hypothetical protein [Sphingopyxis sp.]|uniref:hypothetical protein n=1 Tax=Sphingopyxis sp. TaxID=1908224 RepID=UPI0025FD8507|nr:hypothetical protein [Sphingopyxis sp.]MBR2174979.1 hypothetical protein [Sphingopyxis sp.]
MPTNIPPRGDTAARERHHTLDLIGLRAHATTVGLIQLCEELLNAGVLSTEGLDRIKDAIFTELTVGKRERVARQSNFDETLRGRIDAVFPSIPGDPARDNVGSIEDFEDALKGYYGA